ncbi:methyltransferase domain-containing protein [Streptomyces sp. 3MP-14]|uniref:Methyltransferase domain-containing protein n=1 Tax=Streptomyces mimosae TaxID=2586635 RepID=A0A5N6A2N7_9ACTN|nr:MULTISPECIES: class I SAM-dependent methyltransferase [Streptomyces]KAB8162229.1 methyltransferase domain-containing protein [Streptomyces mimosae]KAB8173872.1 methyltransferase domain-containing protein [Streptomyces sp. 3MP-14]
MPFDHNDHYHRTVLRQLPRGARRALDVGCGTGTFARRLAGLGLRVDALDSSAEALAAARERSAPPPGGPRYLHADVTEHQLPRAHYDFVTCLASLHHVPFATVARLREALAPGGVLVVLGCYAERTPADRAVSLAAVPVNAAARLTVTAGERLRGRPRDAVAAPVRQPTLPLAEIRAGAALLLPGCRVRRLLFWRFLLVFRQPTDFRQPAA